MVNISQSVFINNSATSQGGAIKYDVFRPYLQDNIFTNNTALYGPDIASYPIKVKFVNNDSDKMEFVNVASGIQADQIFSLGLYDHDNQIMNLDSSSQINIRVIDSVNSDLKGTIISTVQNGVALFEEITFIAPPGTSKVNYSVSSVTIDKTKLSRQYKGSFVQENIVTDFRFCEPGESIVTNTCKSCSAGSYSFIWNSTQCKTCMSHANCFGKSVVYVDQGFWRRSLNSTYVAECPNRKA